MVINKSPFDPYTLVHAAAGVAAYHYGLTFWQTLAIGIVWDYEIEPAAKKRLPCLFTHPSQDAKVHQFIDAVTPALTWKLAEWWTRRQLCNGMRY